MNRDDAAQIILLGTAGGSITWAPGPAGAAARYGISTAIAIGGKIYVVDQGLGSARQLTLADPFSRGAGDVMTDLAAFFITHLHSDHVVDLGAFLHCGRKGQPGSTPPLRRARPATTDRQVGPGRTRRAGRRDPGSERRAAAPPGRSAAAPRSLSRPERRAPAPSAARATGCCHLTRRDSFPIMVLRVSLYHIMAPVAEGSNIMRYLSDRRRSCRIVAGSSIMGACDEQRGCAR